MTATPSPSWLPSLPALLGRSMWSDHRKPGKIWEAELDHGSVEREDLSVGAEEREPSTGWRNDARLSLPALSSRPQVGSWHNLYCFFREYRPLLWLSRGLRKQITPDSSVLNFWHVCGNSFWSSLQFAENSQCLLLIHVPIYALSSQAFFSNSDTLVTFIFSVISIFLGTMSQTH